MDRETDITTFYREHLLNQLGGMVGPMTDSDRHPRRKNGNLLKGLIDNTGPISSDKEIEMHDFHSYLQVIDPKATDLTRTDVENYDIEELYEFADATGILERHKALLSQPFNESQVFRHHLFQHY